MTTDDLLRTWFQVCRTSEFIPEPVLEEWTRELKRRRHRDALKDGLRAFTKARCPRCGTKGRFRVLSFGRLSHPGCGDWRMPGGAYLGFVAADAARLGPALIAFPIQVALNRRRQKDSPQEPPPPAGPTCAGCGAAFPEEKHFCPACGRRRKV